MQGLIKSSFLESTDEKSLNNNVQMFHIQISCWHVIIPIMPMHAINLVNFKVLGIYNVFLIFFNQKTILGRWKWQLFNKIYVFPMVSWNFHEWSTTLYFSIPIPTPFASRKLIFRSLNCTASLKVNYLHVICRVILFLNTRQNIRVSNPSQIE